MRSKKKLVENLAFQGKLSFNIDPIKKAQKLFFVKNKINIR